DTQLSNNLPDESTTRRLGRPFENVYATARRFLYEPVVFCDHRSQTNISPFYIYQCIICAFFCRELTNSADTSRVEAVVQSPIPVGLPTTDEESDLGT